jgi:hypothetical protein
MERKQQNDPTAKCSRRHVVQVGTGLVTAPMLMAARGSAYLQGNASPSTRN